MSTAKKRSVLMHNSSNAGGATVIANVAEGAMTRLAFHFLDGLTIEKRFETHSCVKSHARYILRPTSLHRGCLHWQGVFGPFFASAHVVLQCFLPLAG
jgi:hypothetical protein